MRSSPAPSHQQSTKEEEYALLDAPPSPTVYQQIMRDKAIEIEVTRTVWRIVDDISMATRARQKKARAMPLVSQSAWSSVPLDACFGRLGGAENVQLTEDEESDGESGEREEGEREVSEVTKHVCYSMQWPSVSEVLQRVEPDPPMNAWPASANQNSPPNGPMGSPRQMIGQNMSTSVNGNMSVRVERAEEVEVEGHDTASTDTPPRTP